MSSPLPIEPIARAEAVVVHIDPRRDAAGRSPEVEGGFPFALLTSGIAGGVALGFAIALAGAPIWASVIAGWLSGVALVPLLPLMPGIGRRFLRDAEPAAPFGGAEIIPHPLARDLDRWRADLTAEREIAG